MKEYHKLILQRLNEELVEDLDPEKLLRYLFHKEVIDVDDMDEIRSWRVRKDVSEALIHKLMRKGPEAFPELVEGLQQKQPFLACLLLKEETKRLERELEKMKRFEEIKRSQDDLVVEPETTLEEVKLQRDLAESEKSEQCTRCEELETQAKELKNKLQSLELEVKKLNLSKYENLKATLQLLWTALPDTNLENSGQLDQRNDALEGSPESRRMAQCQGSRPSLQLMRESSQDKNMEGSSHDERSAIAASSRNEGDRKEPLQAESRLMAQCQGSRPSTGQRNKDSKTEEGFILRYEGDFDTKGVIHYLGIKAGVNMWRNPARVPSSGVKVTYCDGNGIGDPENILEYFEPVNSYTRSGWCLDLGEKYTLLLTDYTIRQLGSNPKMFLQNFKILGKLYNDDEWRLLSSPDRVDWSLLHWSHSKSRGDKAEACKTYKTKTWSVKGEVKPYRQFKIVQKKDSMPGATRMALAGIELYGVLSV